jgi:hypothetical protein
MPDTGWLRVLKHLQASPDLQDIRVTEGIEPSISGSEGLAPNHEINSHKALALSGSIIIDANKVRTVAPRRSR